MKNKKDSEIEWISIQDKINKEWKINAQEKEEKKEDKKIISFQKFKAAHMVVSPNERDLGIGSMLLDHVIKYASKKGCKRITLLTDKTNIRAQKFYKQHKFNRSSMIPFRMIINNR